MSLKDIVLLEGARTPFTKFCGSFSDISAIDLGAISAKEAVKKSRIEPEEVDQVVFGNVQHSSRDAHIFARHVGLKAGLPIPVPALTINRLCGSGLEAIISAARMIQTGESQVALAGGAENMTQIPFVIRGARKGIPYGGDYPPMEDVLWTGLTDTYAGCNMAITAENLAEIYGLTREEIDQHALLSHERALAAEAKGYLREEIVPVTVTEKKETFVVDKDQGSRKTSFEKLSSLKPRFKSDGFITAGNASGVYDGAASVILASSDYAEKRGLNPIARLVSWDVVGVEPTIMGIGPVPAIRRALQKANMTLGDLDLIEINEAFSAQLLACIKDLDYDLERTNVNGGAVALGHPMAASGTRITTSLIYELGRRGKKYGASSLCIGGGQGIAAIWERL